MGVGHIKHSVSEFPVLLQGLHPCAVHEIGAVAADNEQAISPMLSKNRGAWDPLRIALGQHGHVNFLLISGA